MPARRAIIINQQLILHPRADTCLRLPYTPGRNTDLTLEGDGFSPQTIHFRPDTLRRALPIILQPRIIQLGEVQVRSHREATYRHDTLVLRVDSVRTQPHASATDLLNNMAGATVEAGGQVKVLGKNISRVTVDGKPLYDGNPKAALEALNADMIKELELSDAPGSTDANLNVRLKDNRKQGAYGRVEGLVGTSGTYAGGARASRIQPGQFLNGFVTANNVYEQALTDDDQATLVRNTFLKDIQGSYSVTETALPRPVAAQAGRSLQGLVEAPLNVGRVNTLNGGINYSRTTDKLELFGYALADYSRQEFRRTFTTTRYLSPFRQTDAGSSHDELARTKATAYLAGKWQPTPQQTLTFTTTLGQRTTPRHLLADQTLVLASGADTLSRGTLRQDLTQREQTATANQQLAWTRRYDQPAKVSSLYLQTGYSARLTNQQFDNQVARESRRLDLSRRIRREERDLSWELQAVHAQPIARRLLLEGKLAWSYAQRPVSQLAERLSGEAAYDLPTASLEPFYSRDQQLTARATLYYKGPRLSALLIPTLWHWTGQRRLDETTLLRRERTTFWPGAFVEYRPDAVSKVSVRYGQQQVLPTALQLFPVPDSANIQFVTAGNPLLLPTLRQVTELNAATAFTTHNLSLTLRRALDEQPILTDVRASSLGFLAQTFGQPDQHVRSTAASLLWFQLNQSKAYSLHAFLNGQWQRSALLTQGQALPLRSFVGVGSFGLKWNGPRSSLLKLDWRTIFTQQTTPANGTVHNFRHEPTLRVEKKWGAGLFTQLTAAALLNSYAAGRGNANLLVDFTVSRFLLANERVRLTLTGRNLLNNRVYSLNSFSAGTERLEQIGRLPRFVMVGVSFYPEKWK